jgi:hypothetical protein
MHNVNVILHFLYPHLRLDLVNLLDHFAGFRFADLVMILVPEQDTSRSKPSMYGRYSDQQTKR